MSETDAFKSVQRNLFGTTFVKSIWEDKDAWDICLTGLWSSIQDSWRANASLYLYLTQWTFIQTSNGTVWDVSKGRTHDLIYVINNKALYHCLQRRIRSQNPQCQVELLIQQQWTKFNGITLQTIIESAECNKTQVQPDVSDIL